MASWIEHHGQSAPVPSGTRIEAEQFNGLRITLTTGSVMFDDDGSPEPQRGPTEWSAWKFNDGGPMGPKFRRYRVITSEGRQDRYAATFAGWLKSPEQELA